MRGCKLIVVVVDLLLRTLDHSAESFPGCDSIDADEKRGTDCSSREVVVEKQFLLVATGP
jgi:hypothetical protein